MEKVARCESNLRQFKDDGTLVRGIVDPRDVGLFQISEKYHLETSVKMGLDIHTLEGNVRYAKYLYDKNGLRDWVWSKSCWGNST